MGQPQNPVFYVKILARSQTFCMDCVYLTTVDGKPSVPGQALVCRRNPPNASGNWPVIINPQTDWCGEGTDALDP